MSVALYVVACLTLPALWSLAMYHAFGRWERLRKGVSAGRRDRGADDDLPPADYMI